MVYLQRGEIKTQRGTRTAAAVGAAIAPSAISTLSDYGSPCLQLCPPPHPPALLAPAWTSLMMTTMAETLSVVPRRIDSLTSWLTTP